MRLRSPANCTAEGSKLKWLAASQRYSCSACFGWALYQVESWNDFDGALGARPGSEKLLGSRVVVFVKRDAVLGAEGVQLRLQVRARLEVLRFHRDLQARSLTSGESI